MNLKEAAEFLGLSTKTIERAVKQGKLPSRTIIGERGGKVYQFEQSELERFQAERSAPVHNAAIEKAEVIDTAIITTRHDQTKPDKTRQEESAKVLAKALSRSVPLTDKLTLSFEEAAKVSGISAQRLRQFYKDGKLKGCENIGRGIRIKRADLAAFIGEL